MLKLQDEVKRFIHDMNEKKNEKDIMIGNFKLMTEVAKKALTFYNDETFSEESCKEIAQKIFSLHKLDMIPDPAHMLIRYLVILGIEKKPERIYALLDMIWDIMDKTLNYNEVHHFINLILDDIKRNLNWGIIAKLTLNVTNDRLRERCIRYIETGIQYNMTNIASNNYTNDMVCHISPETIVELSKIMSIDTEDALNLWNIFKEHHLLDVDQDDENFAINETLISSPDQWTLENLMSEIFGSELYMQYMLIVD